MKNDLHYIEHKHHVPMINISVHLSLTFNWML
ncbi:hypothetical protein FHW31_000101 [Enterobacter asburiae]|nr:hypothetical protein P346_03331 [Enterobacter sp. DC1]NIH88736.1 hypothetical protein [Enterobacter asburiae]